jgi:2-keto-4-pentenoate hydratase/2-oxohepta-3-ene-1,7-dioic acid hydratase in catechol pathway
MNIIKLSLLIFLLTRIVWGDMPGIYCRYESNHTVNYGEVEDNIVYQLDNAPWMGGVKTGKSISLEDVKLLHPSEPQVILGLGGSYKNSWKEKNPLKTVRWFLKPPSAAASPDDSVFMPLALDELKVETELVIVIGETVKNADEMSAEKAIFGYTIGNDIMGYIDSYHKIEGEPLDTPENLLGPGLKIGDGFAPFGPFIYTDIDWRNRDWYLKVENISTGKEIIHSDNTNNLVYTPAKIVSDLSKVLTLNPGDVIFTGTSKSLVVGEGDTVTVELEGLGKLINYITSSRS